LTRQRSQIISLTSDHDKLKPNCSFFGSKDEPQCCMKLIPYLQLLCCTTGFSLLYSRMWKVLQEIGKLFKSTVLSKMLAQICHTTQSTSWWIRQLTSAEGVVPLWCTAWSDVISHEPGLSAGEWYVAAWGCHTSCPGTAYHLLILLSELRSPLRKGSESVSPGNKRYID
jgi:hypothetical protein